MTKRGPQAPAVVTVEELYEVVEAVYEAGIFCFDVETRGNIHRHADIMALIEAEWEEKLESLKTVHPTTLARSRQAIEDRWTGQLALDTFRNEVFWISVAVAGRSWAIPMGHPNGEVLVRELRGDGTTVPPPGYRALTKSGKESTAKAKFFVPAVFTDAPEQLTREQVFTALEPIFMDPSIPKVNQNVKFDCKSVAKYLGGRLPAGTYIDTQDLMHVANENLKNYRLGTILEEVFDFDPYWRDGKIGKTIVHEPFSKACRYVHYDSRWAWLTYKRLWRMISAVPTLFDALMIDVPAYRVVAQIERNGVLVNKREMKKLGKELDMELNGIIREIAQHVPDSLLGFNPASNADKQQLLFAKKSEGGLGLKSKKKTESGNPSVDSEALKAVQDEHPVVPLLLKYAEVTKLKSTYVEGMTPLLHNVGDGKWLGRLHPQFHFHRTVTGRFSSSDPNLQNIPRDGRMRNLFVAGPGDSLVVADYSQIEMRLMAMFSQDEAMMHIFEAGIDAHTGTATVILGRPPADSEERNVYGKVPNFLLGYGGGAKRLVASTNGKIGLEQAQEIVTGYDKGYAGYTDWKQRTISLCRKRGYVETLGGRRRRVPEINADVNAQGGWYARTSAERQAINAIIQGTAAEILKKAMVKLDGVLEYPKCKMVLQVHDELVTSVPTDEVGLWLPIIESSMGNGTYITDKPGDDSVKPVKLVVEAHSAGSWAEAKG